jgi:hypothetical protein
MVDYYRAGQRAQHTFEFEQMLGFKVNLCVPTPFSQTAD